MLDPVCGPRFPILQPSTEGVVDNIANLMTGAGHAGEDALELGPSADAHILREGVALPTFLVGAAIVKWRLRLRLRLRPCVFVGVRVGVVIIGGLIIRVAVWIRKRRVV